MTQQEIRFSVEDRATLYTQVLTLCQYFNTLVEKMGLKHDGWDSKMPALVNMHHPDDPALVVGSAHTFMRSILVRKKKFRHYLELLKDEKFLLRGEELRAHSGVKNKIVDDYLVSHNGAWAIYFHYPPPQDDVVELVALMRKDWEAQEKKPPLQPSGGGRGGTCPQNLLGR